MSSNKAKDTLPEILFRRRLWKERIRGYRLHEKILSCKPDIVLRRAMLVIFVHGCFWHRCPHCKLVDPKTNSNFWVDKFKKNVDRDERKIRELTDAGWQVIVAWECEVKNEASLDHVIRKVSMKIAAKELS